MVGKAIRDGTTSVGVGTTAMGFCSWGERLASTPNAAWATENYSQTAGWGSMNENLLRGNIKIKGGLLLNAAQGDQTSRGKWWSMRNPIRYWGWSNTEDGTFWLNGLSRIFAKIRHCRDKHQKSKDPKSGPSWKRPQSSLSEFGQGENLCQATFLYFLFSRQWLDGLRLLCKERKSVGERKGVNVWNGEENWIGTCKGLLRLVKDAANLSQ